MRKRARGNRVHPPLEILGHILDGFTLTESRLRVVKEYRAAAHALHAHIKSCPRAQRRLLKNQRKVFARKRRAVIVGARLDVGSQTEQIAHRRRRPFHAGNKIARQVMRKTG